MFQGNSGHFTDLQYLRIFSVLVFLSGWMLRWDRSKKKAGSTATQNEFCSTNLKEGRHTTRLNNVLPLHATNLSGAVRTYQTLSILLL